MSQRCRFSPSVGCITRGTLSRLHYTLIDGARKEPATCAFFSVPNALFAQLISSHGKEFVDERRSRKQFKKNDRNFLLSRCFAACT